MDEVRYAISLVFIRLTGVSLVLMFLILVWASFFEIRIRKLLNRESKDE